MQSRCILGPFSSLSFRAVLTRNTLYISHSVQFSVGPYGKVSLRISMMTAPSPKRPLIRMRPLNPDETLKKKKTTTKTCLIVFAPRRAPGLFGCAAQRTATHLLCMKGRPCHGALCTHRQPHIKTSFRGLVPAEILQLAADRRESHVFCCFFCLVFIPVQQPCVFSDRYLLLEEIIFLPAPVCWRVCCFFCVSLLQKD